MSSNAAPGKEQKIRSGIDVLVVGTGIGGLFAAIELHRKGHSVKIVEAKNALEEAGKNPSRRWPQLKCDHVNR